MSGVSQPGARRSPTEEREEIHAHLVEAPPEPLRTPLNEEPGRVPTGPARGWRARERRAKSCEICEGDLWVEDEDGRFVPCPCRERRAKRRALTHMRAGNWLRGTSLSFASQPLAQVEDAMRDAVERLCAGIRAGEPAAGLWLHGPPGSHKSALCAYIAQRLYPSGDADAHHLGDLLAHLRWLGAIKGEAAVARRIDALTEIPLLVIDDLDRAHRSYPGKVPLALRESCSAPDLIRLAGILRGRQAALLPTVITSRSRPEHCLDQMTAFSPPDLARALLTTLAGEGDPIEDNPSYIRDLLGGAITDLRGACERHDLERPRLAEAA